MNQCVARYIETLTAHAGQAAATLEDGGDIELDAALEALVERMLSSHEKGGRTWLIGNGGSSAVASHLANDFSKNGGVRASAFTDASLLTCLSNDFGYETVYSKALEFQAQSDDGLIAISSSGKSPNIVMAVAQARRMGLWVATLSGFDQDNQLRTLGDINIYVNSMAYGFVELSHFILLHAALDLNSPSPARPPQV
jgi:D-sedoheptulose 7-phosphate isomerase